MALTAFIETIKQCPEEELAVIADHLANEFPQHADSLRASQKVASQYRVQTMRHVLRGAVTALERDFHEPMQATQSHPPRFATLEEKEDETLRHTANDLRSLSDDWLQQEAARLQKDPAELRREIWERVYKSRLRND